MSDRPWTMTARLFAKTNRPTAITVLSLVVALGPLTPASLPHLPVGSVVLYVVWGISDDVPLSVEPWRAFAGTVWWRLGR